MIRLTLLLSSLLFGCTNSFTIADYPLLSTRCNIISFATSSPNDSESPSSVDTTKNRADLRYIDESIQRQISTIFSSTSSNGQLDGFGSTFVPLSFAGRCTIDNNQSSSVFASSSNIETIFLSTPEQCQSISETYIQYLKSTSSKSKSNTYQPSTTIKALPIPISQSYTTSTIKLLSTTYTNTPISKSVLLSLNSLFINRDNGLYDNLPWSTWSIDPQLYERDAAKNIIDEKFTMGKRVVYQRMMGKDWQGRSLSLGNLILKVRYLLERDDDDNDNVEVGRGTDDTDDDTMLYSLSKRLLQLEIKEAQMYIAECEQRVAIATNNNEEVDTPSSDIDEATAQLDKARERLQLAETSLGELNKETDNTSTSKQSKTSQSLVSSILDKFTEQDNPAPYRGAIGYPAKLDTKKEMLEDSILPYSSPYDLLLEIIDEQLNSKVIGCVLEPTSLIEGNLVLGGALLLQRKGVMKTTSISGESVSYTDDDDELGNKGVLPRSMYVVECYADEAIGMAMAANMPLFVEEDIHTRAGQVEVELDIEQTDSIKEDNGDEENHVVDSLETLSFTNRIPLVRPIDDSFLIAVEGERISSERESNQVRIPLTTNPDFFDNSQVAASSSSRPVFSTFNPVKSLGEYDELTDDAKARLLLKLESFTGQLPRPRAVRLSYNSNSGPSILDEMLIPLVDESIRRQYRIRDAERRNDVQEVERLRKEASPRQVALERLQKAQKDEELLGIDNEEVIRLAEEEAELYKTLRADITQDEGTYSQYLDRDEWYERETQARIARERERQLRKKS